MRKEIFRVFLMSAAMSLYLLFSAGFVRAQDCGTKGLPPCPTKPKPKPTTKPATKPTVSKPTIPTRKPQTVVIKRKARNKIVPQDVAESNQNKTKNNGANNTFGETTFWNSIENSSDAQDFENYISRSNSGEFSGTYKATAELKLNRLRRSETVAKWQRIKPIAKNLLRSCLKTQKGFNRRSIKRIIAI